jgi:hypothetical protein
MFPMLQGQSGAEAPLCRCKNHDREKPSLLSYLQEEKPGAGIFLFSWPASKPEPEMDSGSVGKEVQSEVRVVAMTKMAWFVVIAVGVKTVPRISVMVSAKLVASVSMFSAKLVAPLTMFSVKGVPPVTLFVVMSLAGAIAAVPCLRWRRPSDQKHCRKTNYENFADVFHFDPPFICINRLEDKKGYRLINKFT